MPMLLGIERQTERRAKRTAENSDPRSDPPVDLGLLDLGEIVWEIERKCQYWIFIYDGGKHLSPVDGEVKENSCASEYDPRGL